MAVRKKAKTPEKRDVESTAAPEARAVHSSNKQFEAVVFEREQEIAKLLPEIAKQKTEALAQFFEMFSDDIYNFPMRTFQFNEDEASEFYLYAFERLRDGRKIATFQSKAKFTTWFYAVLRNLAIDFLRAQNDKLSYSAYLRTNASGKIVEAIEAVAEKEKQSSYEEELFESFKASLASLQLEHRVLLKLAFAWYFDLDCEEWTYLLQRSALSEVELAAKLGEIKQLAHDRSLQVRDFEAKLTENFQTISLLETRLDIFFRENPEVEKQREMWSETYVAANLPSQIVDIIHSLMKRKKKQETLLLSQKKSLLSIRAPYKNLCELLQSTQGIISVQLIRVIERLSQGLK